MEAILRFILTILNLLGGLVSGVWLGIIGEWWAIGYGIGSLFFSPFVLGLAMIPGMIFALPAGSLIEKGKLVFGYPLIFLNSVYTYALMTAWCVFVLWFFLNSATEDSFWPLLIWSYGVATRPWLRMSPWTYEDSLDSMTGAFFAQVGYILMGLSLLLFPTSLIDPAIVFALTMVLAITFQTIIAAQAGFDLLLSFEGRIKRRAWWAAVGPLVIVCFLVDEIFYPYPDNIVLRLFPIAVYAIFYWVFYAVCAKRWHDRNKSGFWTLIHLVPIIGIIWIIIECGCMKGTIGENDYGPEPN